MCLISVVKIASLRINNLRVVAKQRNVIPNNPRCVENLEIASRHNNFTMILHYNQILLTLDNKETLKVNRQAVRRVK